MFKKILNSPFWAVGITMLFVLGPFQFMSAKGHVWQYATYFIVVLLALWIANVFYKLNKTTKE